MKISWGIFKNNMVIKIFDTKEECEGWVKLNNIDYDKIAWGNYNCLKSLLRWEDKGWDYVEGKGWTRNAKWEH